MKLPLKTSYAAIEAKAVDRLLSGEGWQRTADCVGGGFRYASRGTLVGSLLLGLYDDDGLLHHCGFTSSFTEAEREVVTRKKLLRWRPDKAPRQCTFDQVLAKKVKRSSSRKTRGATAA